MKRQFGNLVPNRHLNMFDAFERKSKGCDKGMGGPIRSHKDFFLLKNPLKEGFPQKVDLSVLCHSFSFHNL